MTLVTYIPTGRLAPMYQVFFVIARSYQSIQAQVTCCKCQQTLPSLAIAATAITGHHHHCLSKLNDAIQSLAECSSQTTTNLNLGLNSLNIRLVMLIMVNVQDLNFDFNRFTFVLILIHLSHMCCRHRRGTL